MKKPIVVDDGEDGPRFIFEEDWRELKDHPKYEMNVKGEIRHRISKKPRNELNGSFRYYENGVRKGVPIHILIEQTFPEES